MNRTLLGTPLGRLQETAAATRSVNGLSLQTPRHLVKVDRS